MSPATDAPHVVVFSSLFPSRLQPGAGLFVRERAFRVGDKLPICVVAPSPWFPLQGLLARLRPGFRPGAPNYEHQSDRDVWFPRFLSFPGVLKRWDGLLMAFGAWPRLRWLKRRGRLDLIDSHFGYPDGYAATLLGRWLGVPVTITMRGTEGRHAQDPVLRGLLKTALLRANKVFTVSESLRQIALRLGAAPNRVLVVGNGVDIDKFQPVPKVEARIRLALDQNAPVLISVGGLVERKGFHRVMDCLPELLKRFPGLIYLVVGGASPEGDWTERLKTQASTLGVLSSVRFLGSLPSHELKWPLSAADVFVLATRNEGWANVFLEAMACGLPVVTTDVGGNAEVVCRPDLGTIIPFGDAGALRQAIEQALEFSWSADRLRSYALDNTWDRRVETLVREFNQLVADGKRSPGQAPDTEREVEER